MSFVLLKEKTNITFILKLFNQTHLFLPFSFRNHILMLSVPYQSLNIVVKVLIQWEHFVS